MAMEWIKHVGGAKRFPKLPVHLQNYRKHFDRNWRIKNAFKQAKARRDLLKELNEKLLSSPAEPNEEAATTPSSNRQPAPYLTTWEPIVPQQPMEAPIDSARTGLPQVEIGGTSINRCPEVTVMDSSTRKKNRGQRGQDVRTQKRRRCARCKGKFSDKEAIACAEANRREYCKRFNVHGNQIN